MDGSRLDSSKDKSGLVETRESWLVSSTSKEEKKQRGVEESLRGEGGESSKLENVGLFHP